MGSALGAVFAPSSIECVFGSYFDAHLAMTSEASKPPSFERAPSTVTCTPPSGTTFPTGSTTIINCTAIDHAGNQTSNSFSVTISGIGNLFAALRAQIQATRTDVTQKNQMLAYVAVAEGLLTAGQPQLTCLQMRSLDLYIRSQVSRRRIIQQDANLLYVCIADIRIAIGCGTT